jgi:hypothetical protein
VVARRQPYRARHRRAAGRHERGRQRAHAAAGHDRRRRQSRVRAPRRAHRLRGYQRARHHRPLRAATRRRRAGADRARRGRARVVDWHCAGVRSQRNVHVARPGGRHRRLVTSGVSPDWSPGGRRLALVRPLPSLVFDAPTGRIYTVAPSGGRLRRVGRARLASHPVSGPRTAAGSRSTASTSALWRSGAAAAAPRARWRRRRSAARAAQSSPRTPPGVRCADELSGRSHLGSLPSRSSLSRPSRRSPELSVFIRDPPLRLDNLCSRHPATKNDRSPLDTRSRSGRGRCGVSSPARQPVELALCPSPPRRIRSPGEPAQGRKTGQRRGGDLWPGPGHLVCRRPVGGGER